MSLHRYTLDTVVCSVLPSIIIYFTIKSKKPEDNSTSVGQNQIHPKMPAPALQFHEELEAFDNNDIVLESISQDHFDSDKNNLHTAIDIKVQVEN